MRSLEVRQSALALAAAGVNDCEIARRLGIPRTTVRDWRAPRYTPKRSAPGPCPRCWRPGPRLAFAPGDYAELLATYLGDGHISQLARAQRLRIFLDAGHPTVVDETEALLSRCFPENKIGRATRHQGRMVVLAVHSRHLDCLFPQHGPGKKHERSLLLEPWQRALVAESPWRFLRGCIRTDGCVFVNRTGRYEYLSYAFCNLSCDLLDLFVSTCESVGLRPRRTARDVRLNRRGDVALLVEHVGLKG